MWNMMPELTFVYAENRISKQAAKNRKTPVDKRMEFLYTAQNE